MPCLNKQAFMKSVKVDRPVQWKEIPQRKMMELNLPTGSKNLIVSKDCFSLGDANRHEE